MSRGLSRRAVLGLGLGVTSGLALAGCGESAPKVPPPHPGPAAAVKRLPGDTKNLAWTVDDGADLATLQAYLDLVRTSAVPVTFCVTHLFAASWEAVKLPLRELIAAGTAQVVNHTWSHQTLTELSDDDVRRELERNEEWIEQTFRVTSRPYLRPPNGAWDARVARLCGDLGYTKLLLWSSSLGDSAAVSSAQLLTNAKRAFYPGAVVLGHANAPTVTHHFPDILGAIKAQGLQPVTLDTALGTSRQVG